MDYGTLQNRVASWLHRSDLSGEIPDFIDQARQRINRRFGTEYPQLVNTTDTNASLTEHGDMWLFASLVEGYTFLHNGAAAEAFDGRYGAAANQINITSKQADGPHSFGFYTGEAS